jgi:hypothetical protein
LVKLAIPRCQEAERECPRTGPGRKPEIPDWVLAVMIVTGVLMRKKTKSAQYRWWCQHQAEFARWLPGQRLPARSTFFDRYRRAERLYALYGVAVRQQGNQAIRRGWAKAGCVATDKSLIAGQGRRWWPRQRRQNKVPRGIDRDTTWGYSKHDGWVQGYSYEVVVSAGKKGPIWPFLVSVDTASRSEQRSFAQKVSQLPKSTRHVLADAGYDSNALAEQIEWDGRGRRTGRRFLCPEVPRPNVGRRRQAGSRETLARQEHRRLRNARCAYFKSPEGRCLYARRKTRAEPFNAQFKRLFELQDRVWHWGLPNNRTMLMAAMLAFQLLLTYNHIRRKPNAHLQRVLDGL